MVATAGGVAFALAPLVAVVCLVRLARRLRALPVRVPGLDRDRRRRSRCSASRSGAVADRRLHRARLRLGVVLLHRHNIAAPARRHRAALLAGRERGPVDGAAAAATIDPGVRSARGQPSRTLRALAVAAARSRSSPCSPARRALRHGAARSPPRTGRRPSPAARSTSIYAVPSDGADRSAERAAQISADVDEIGAWWRSQDFEREPRFDLTAFACGVQVDIVVVRLPEPDGRAVPSNPGSRFERIAERRRVGRAAFEKHLVYYDGPVDDGQLCGQGGGSPTARASRSSTWRRARTSRPRSSRPTSCCTRSVRCRASGPPHACPDDARAPVRLHGRHAVPVRADRAARRARARRRPRRLLRPRRRLARRPGLAAGCAS